MIGRVRSSLLLAAVLGAGTALAGSWSAWEPCVNDAQISKRVKSMPASSGRCWWTWQLRNDHDETVDIEYMYSFEPGQKKFDHRALRIEPGDSSEGAHIGPCSTFYVDARAARR